MANRMILTAVAVSLLAAPAYAAQARKKAEPPPPPPQFHVDVATRSMNFDRMVSQITSGAVIGEFFTGLLCIGNTTPIYANYAFSGNTQDYIRVFNGEAEAAGYRIAAAQGALFNGAAPASDLLVGAAILDLRERGCGTAGTIEATITMDWQVFDPSSNKLLFRATTQGTATANSSSGAQTTRPADAARLAFQQAAKTVLADPNFVVAVRDPKGGAPGQGGSLFNGETETTPGQRP